MAVAVSATSKSAQTMNSTSDQVMRSLRSCSIGAMLVMGLACSSWAQNGKPISESCLVASFRAVALGTHDVEMRAVKAEEWLRSYAASCTTQQLSSIQGNSSSWLGHALTPRLSGIIEGLLEARVAGNPALMAKMYESLGKEREASVDRAQTPTPRAPVVPPNMMPAPPVLIAPPMATPPMATSLMMSPPMPNQPGAGSRPGR